MWISRVDELESPKDAVPSVNPFRMQNNMDSLRSPLTAQQRTAANRVHAAAAGASNEAGVMLSLSRQGRNLSAAYTVPVSGVDMNLFAAD